MLTWACLEQVSQSIANGHLEEVQFERSLEGEMVIFMLKGQSSDRSISMSELSGKQKSVIHLLLSLLYQIGLGLVTCNEWTLMINKAMKNYTEICI